MRVEPLGFKAAVTFGSNKELNKSYSFTLDEYESGSLKADFRAYPNVLGSMMDGVKSIIREPHGCFEQVSSYNYPNIFALLYLDEMKMENPEVRKQAKKYLSMGYAKLAGYECVGGGFDWYGQNPANMRLTAYGLLQFMDMKKVYRRVDDAMIARTAAWLAKKRDDQGGWESDNWYYGGHVSNAYVTYAMSVYGKIDIQREVNYATKEALKGKDWYLLSLAAMSNWHVGNKKEANKVLDVLMVELEKGDLMNPNAQTTMSYSYGHSRNVETHSMMAQAIMTLERDDYAATLSNIIVRISESKRGHGYFGSTQATVQALKALYLYAKKYNKEERKGSIFVYVNNTLIKNFGYNNNTTQTLYYDFSRFLKAGNNTIDVKFTGDAKAALPYSFNAEWSTLKPSSSPNCLLDLKTTIAKKNVKIGETVRITTELSNTNDEFLFNPIALIGIPAGLSLQPWQLKELQDKKVFDYYEIRDNYLVLYFRNIEEKSKKTIHLDLKADFVGTYKGCANSAYLYYGAEDKVWESGIEVDIQ